MEWDPSRFFGASGSSSPYALLILHQPINEKAFDVLRKHACFIICADGGANRLYDMTKAVGTESKHLPDVVMGDLDSIRPAVREHYEKLGVRVIRDPDQYSTDFTKCLKFINAHAAEIIASPREGDNLAKLDSEKAPESESTSVAQSEQALLDTVIMGGLGGRVDQAFSQVHHLYMMTETQRAIRRDANSSASLDNRPSAGGKLYLLSEESITFIIHEGKNTIYTPATNRADLARLPTPKPDESPSKKSKVDDPEEEYLFEENIGIIPITAPAILTTRGFEWDVENWHSEIGGQLSTSNHIRADKVEVETSTPVLFTLELAERLKRRS
ncbi:thiamine pyrophosphokinase eukaryotic [Penicillium brevicompactum]|uniref:Thiamine pyrophosphokinase n=1 Tax=Penicillium brevicompactum TaxID=5074 RepID=A0A9W9USR9_PENBR|nr:thiamine pyrophosphokinase eukaryotic [Penicillium brevicompactum]